MGLLNPTAWICIGLGVVNALAGSVYGYVKRMARQGKKRVGDCKLLRECSERPATARRVARRAAAPPLWRPTFWCAAPAPTHAARRP